MADIADIRTIYHWIAIDVARYWNVVLIETAAGQRHRFKMSNTAQDFERLITFIQDLGGRARAGLEPTGDYHRALAHRLAQAGVEVVGIPSVAQSRYREAMFHSWDKNDPKDAGVILEMLKQGRTQQYVDPMLAGHWSSTRSDWWVRFMIEFPTPAHVRQLSQEASVAAAWSIVGRKVNKQGKLEEIWSMAEHSAALPHMPESLAVETFRMTLRHFQQLTALRAEIEQRAEAVLCDNPDYACLKSLPGIGPIIALTILAEGGDLRRLGHHRQFLKYCGFDLAKNQSGMQRGRAQLSKRGNARLRLAFWMAGQVAIRLRENAFKDKYERYISANPDDADLRRKALTAVAAKMARVAYGLVKKHQPYRRFFEQSLPSGLIPLSRAVGAPARPGTL